MYLAAVISPLRARFNGAEIIPVVVQCQQVFDARQAHARRCNESCGAEDAAGHFFGTPCNSRRKTSRRLNGYRTNARSARERKKATQRNASNDAGSSESTSIFCVTRNKDASRCAHAMLECDAHDRARRSTMNRG
jgi:hypothetical protein